MLCVQLESDEGETAAWTENSCHFGERLGLVRGVLQGVDRHHCVG
jgi:hypothetical protein